MSRAPALRSGQSGALSLVQISPDTVLSLVQISPDSVLSLVQISPDTALSLVQISRDTLLSLVQTSRDTLLSLVELYYVGAKVYAITTHLMASKMSPTRGILCISLCCYGNAPEGGHFVL